MKDINIVNKIVSKKLNKQLNIVNIVNKFYWKESRERLVSLNQTTIFLKHIGSITISKYKLYKEILRLIKRVRFVAKSDNYKDEAKEKIIGQVKHKLTKLLHHRNILAKEEYDKRISTISLEIEEEDDIDIESYSDED